MSEVAQDSVYYCEADHEPNSGSDSDTSSVISLQGRSIEFGQLSTDESDFHSISDRDGPKDKLRSNISKRSM